MTYKMKECKLVTTCRVAKNFIIGFGIILLYAQALLFVTITPSFSEDTDTHGFSTDLYMVPINIQDNKISIPRNYIYNISTINNNTYIYMKMEIPGGEGANDNNIRCFVITNNKSCPNIVTFWVEPGSYQLINSNNISNINKIPHNSSNEDHDSLQLFVTGSWRRYFIRGENFNKASIYISCVRSNLTGLCETITYLPNNIKLTLRFNEANILCWDSIISKASSIILKKD